MTATITAPRKKTELRKAIKKLWGECRALAGLQDIPLKETKRTTTELVTLAIALVRSARTHPDAPPWRAATTALHLAHLILSNPPAELLNQISYAQLRDIHSLVHEQPERYHLKDEALQLFDQKLTEIARLHIGRSTRLRKKCRS